MATKLAIREVLGLEQKGPAIFEVECRLEGGSTAIVEVSTVALADLTQRAAKIFKTKA